MILALADENEKLNVYITEIESELEKEKELTQNLKQQKKDVEYELQMLRNEKTAFMDILARANRTESNIFDDG